MPSRTTPPLSIPSFYGRHVPISAKQARALDRRASQEFGLPSAVLMDHAARGVAVLVASLVPPQARILVACGPGNNGGDGYGVARHLQSWGWAPLVVRLAASPPLSGDAALEYGLAARGAQIEGGLEASPARRAALMEGIDLVVDAIFGLGPLRPLGKPYVDWLKTLNGSAARRVALDVPSGMDADTGRERPLALRADVTATMVAPKRGFRARPDLVGEVVEIDIGLPADLHRPLLTSPTA